MKKLIISILIILCSVSIVFAKPFLSCDSQEGVTQYKIETPIQPGVSTHWERIIPALEGGTLMWNLQEWPHGKGLFHGAVSAGGDWEITDADSGVKTIVFEYSESSEFVIKVPSYKVKNIRGR